MRDMVEITQNQLEGMRSRLKFEHCFRLATAIVNMIFICWNVVDKLIRTVFSLTDGRTVQKQVMVTGIFFFSSRWSHAHSGETENHLYGAAERVTILKVHKINLGIRVRRVSPANAAHQPCSIRQPLK